MVRFFRVVIVLVLVTSSCSKIQLYDEGIAADWRNSISSFQDQGVTVDEVKVKNGAFVFQFSGGKKMGFSPDKVPLMTIDVRGYWRIGNKLTDKELEAWSEEEMILANAGDGEFVGIIEGYTGWSFYFSDRSSVTLKKTIFSYDPDNRMRGINHRGYSSSAPENTLAAFRKSRLMGFRYVETDIRFSSDGVPVLLHDDTVNRTSNGRGKVADLSWKELQALDFGLNFHDYKNTRIPSLDEFLALCREIGLVPYLELKAGSMDQIGEIVRLVGEYGFADKAVYISFYDYLLRYVLDSNPSATVGLLVEYVDSETVINTALSLRSESSRVFIDSSDYSEAAVRSCRNSGIPLEVWTINASSIIKSLSDYVSGVTSDQLHAGRVLLGK